MNALSVRSLTEEYEGIQLRLFHATIIKIKVGYELGFCIRDDGILHSYRRENLKSYVALTV
jgi:hypothetical protein